MGAISIFGGKRRFSAPEDFSLIFAHRNFGPSQSGALYVAPFIGMWGFLLIRSPKIDRCPESPFKCFEAIVALLVRLWAANTFNIQDVGPVDV